MEKEEDISFRSVLHNVITGHEPPKVLLDHPEFQCRVRRFCKQIDRSGRSEDLVRQVCLHILQSGHLKKADLQNENQFFRWFFVAAGNHLRARSRDCIEPSKDWPNTTAGLAFEKLDQFFAHADVCPYHRRILLIEGTAEEEKFNSLVQAARGLDPHGVIHSVEHLNAATQDVKERLHVWNEAALTRGLLFEYIGLYNAEKRIATVSRFFDVRIHVSTHELDPRAGLQIRAMTDKDSNYEVPLGKCDLIGVRHDNIEQHFPLANGYTVGLSIKQHTRTKFTLGFRCVRTELINKEQADLNEHVEREAGVTENSGHIDLKQPNQVHGMPGYIAASLLESSWSKARAWLLGLFLVLLLPVLQSLERREGVAPHRPAKSDVQAQPSNSDKAKPQRDEGTSQNRVRRRTKRSASSLNQASSGSLKAIRQELGKQITQLRMSP
jgi:hypothetical protein